MTENHPVFFAKEKGSCVVVLVFEVDFAGKSKRLRQPKQIRILAFPVPAYRFPGLWAVAAKSGMLSFDHQQQGSPIVASPVKFYIRKIVPAFWEPVEELRGLGERGQVLGDLMVPGVILRQNFATLDLADGFA